MIKNRDLVTKQGPKCLSWLSVIKFKEWESAGSQNVLFMSFLKVWLPICKGRVLGWRVRGPVQFGVPVGSGFDLGYHLGGRLTSLFGLK